MAKFGILSMVAVGMLFATDAARPIAVAAEGESLRARTDRLAKPYVESDVVVGMTVGILKDGKREVFGYGQFSRDDKRVPDGDTIYEIGSVGKVLTGFLLADAVVQGKVKLDLPAGELLPKGIKMPSRGDREITLKDLATHVSGLPRIPDNMPLGDPTNPYADYTSEKLYEFLNQHELEQEPGTKSEYSNLGFGLLGHLLALQANCSYDELVKNRIAVPLKMSSTTMKLDKGQKLRLAPGHAAGGQPASNWDDEVLAGAGSHRGTVNDLLLFAAASLNPPKDKLGQALEMAWTVQKKPIKKGDHPVGLGWHIDPDETRWHNGQSGGYHSMMLVSRKTTTAVIVVANTAAMELDVLAHDIAKMLSGKEVEPRKFAKSIDVPKEALQKFLGQYEVTPEAVLTVEEADGKLSIAMTGQPSLIFAASAENVWHSNAVDATITFNVDQDGKCDSLVLSQANIEQTARRKKEPAEMIPTLVGKYVLPSGTEFTVENQGGKLMVALTGQGFNEVFPTHSTEWFYKGIKAKITFNLDEKGKCQSLVLHQNGIKQTAKRKRAPGEVEEEEKDAEVPEATMKKLVGRYQIAPGAVLKVEVKDKKLMVALTGQPSFQVFPRSEKDWYYKEVDAKLTFNLDKNGKCDSLVLHQNGGKKTAKRTK